MFIFIKTSPNIKSFVGDADFFEDRGRRGKFVCDSQALFQSQILQGDNFAFFVPFLGKSNKRLAFRLLSFSLSLYSYKMLVTAAGSRNV